MRKVDNGKKGGVWGETGKKKKKIMMEIVVTIIVTS